MENNEENKVEGSDTANASENTGAEAAQPSTKVVKLLAEYDDNGTVREAGTELELSTEVADKLVADGKAEAVTAS